MERKTYKVALTHGMGLVCGAERIRLSLRMSRSIYYRLRRQTFIRLVALDLDLPYGTFITFITTELRQITVLWGFF